MAQHGTTVVQNSSWPRTDEKKILRHHLIEGDLDAVMAKMAGAALEKQLTSQALCGRGFEWTAFYSAGAAAPSNPGLGRNGGVSWRSHRIDYVREENKENGKPRTANP